MAMQSPIHVFARSQCVQKSYLFWRFQDILAYGTVNCLAGDLAGFAFLDMVIEL
jgi:hypothetical protein